MIYGTFCKQNILQSIKKVSVLHYFSSARLLSYKASTFKLHCHEYSSSLKKEKNTIIGPGVKSTLEYHYYKFLPGHIIVRHFSQSNTHHQKQDDKKDPPEEEKVPMTSLVMFILSIGTFIYLSFLFQPKNNIEQYRYISFNEFLNNMLSKGEVESIEIQYDMDIAIVKLHPGAVLKGKVSDARIYLLKIPDADKFEEKVKDAEREMGVVDGVPISYRRMSPYGGMIITLIIGAALFLLARNFVKNIPSGMNVFSQITKAKFVRADLTPQHGEGVTFKDIAGLHEAKVEIMEFVDYLKNPERYKKLGAKLPRGALMLGPPGCGKTLLAKALANESGVPFLAMGGSEFVEMLGGLGAARVRDLFKEAKANAPCILYVDEIDAIGRKRAGNPMGYTGGGEEEHTLNQLLVEMDGMTTSEGVIMLASTNRADVLDKALLRPGRLDRKLTIDLPTLAERIELFDLYLKRLKMTNDTPKLSAELAQLSPGMSGADIANICNEAALHAARNKKAFVEKADFDYAVDRAVAGVVKKSRVLSHQEKKIIAYHEAGHAVVGWLLKHTDKMMKATILPRTNSFLGFTQYLPSDRKLISKEALFDRMCLSLAGGIAEKITFNTISSGAENDLKKVTDIAYRQIQEFGMGESTGLLSFDQNKNQSFSVKPYSDFMSNLIDTEARQLIHKCHIFTNDLLLANSNKLKVVAEALMEKETLTYTDMEELIGPPQFVEK